MSFSASSVIDQQQQKPVQLAVVGQLLPQLWYQAEVAEEAVQLVQAHHAWLDS